MNGWMRAWLAAGVVAGIAGAVPSAALAGDLDGGLAGVEPVLAAREPITTEQIQARIHAFEDWAASADRDTLTAESPGRLQRLLAGIEFASLDIDQLALITPWIIADRGRIEEGIQAAGRFANGAGAEAATALTLEIWLQISVEYTMPSPTDLGVVLDHPGLSESIRGSNAEALYSLLGIVTRYGRDELFGPFAEKIGGALAQSGGVTRAAALLRAAEAAMAYQPRVEWSRYAPVRAALLPALERVVETVKREVEREALQGALPYVRLIGGEAPELEFVWTSGELGALRSAAAEGDAEEAGDAAASAGAVTALSGLRGRVVVLDFWATWCKPCIAAFPKMAQLQERYKDAPVTILGVTSAQGFHMSGMGAGATRVETRREDGSIDEAREHELMQEFIAAHPSLTWPVVFTRERVFNESYFVTGIPHLTLIAPDGTVRANALRPGMSIEDLGGQIDAILREFGLTGPG